MNNDTIKLNSEEAEKSKAKPCIRVQDSKWIDLAELIERNIEVIERLEKRLNELEDSND